MAFNSFRISSSCALGHAYLAQNLPRRLYTVICAVLPYYYIESVYEYHWTIQPKKHLFSGSSAQSQVLRKNIVCFQEEYRKSC